MAKNWALVIGINEYNPLNFAPLKYAKRDAEKVKAFFETAGFERVFFFSDNSPRQTLPNGIEIPTQATYGNLISFLQGFFENRFLNTGDNFWFFFAGHGERYHDEDYLMPMDANAIGSEVITGLKVNYVRERLCRCGADNIILILDACRSQGSRDGSGLGLEVQQGVITIASCQPKQKSWEVDELEQGVFTYALLEALQLPGEQSCATVERLGSYLQRRVPELCQRYSKAPAQLPRIGADPIEKQHFILIPQYARQADLDLLKLDAYRLSKTNPAMAECICLRLNALAMGRDLEVIDLLTDLRRQTRYLTSAPSEPTPPPTDSASARFATTATTTTVSNVSTGNFFPDGTTLTERTGQREEFYEKTAEQLLTEIEQVEAKLVAFESSADRTTHHKLKPPDVGCKELSECDPSKILFIKNVRDPNGDWAYTLNHIQEMGGSAESRVFELFWLPSSKGAKSASKGDLMLLNQQAKITHIVEMLDDDVRENSTGYFRWVCVVWMPEEANWSKLPHQREIIGFEPPTIGGGTAYSLANLKKFQKTWSNLETFQQHVFQKLTTAKSPINEVTDLDITVHIDPHLQMSEQGLNRFDLDVDELSSEQLGADYYSKLRDMLVAQDWKAADQETADRMFEVMKRQKEGWLRVEDINNFPLLDLRNIDHLWVKYSQDKFGFSVQREIYLKCGATLNGEYPGDKIWFEFCDRVGWLKNGNISYDSLIFDNLSSSPAGQLPCKIVIRRQVLWGLGGDFMGCILWKSCSFPVD